jgi:hypothetical protein
LIAGLVIGTTAPLGNAAIIGNNAPSPSTDELAVTLPDPSQIGPVPDYDGTVMQHNSVGDDACSFEIAGWEMANSSDGEFGARRLEGEVVIGHTPHGDAVINHHNRGLQLLRRPGQPQPTREQPDHRLPDAPRRGELPDRRT